ESPCDLADLEDLELIADFDIVVATQGDTAIEAGPYFLDVVLETTQGVEGTRPDDHVVAQQADLRVATYNTVGDHTTCDFADARNAVDLADFDHPDHFFPFLGSKHAGQRVAYVVYGIVDDVVVTQVDAVVLGQLLRALFCAHVEADDDGIRGDGQVDVAFRDTTHGSVDHLHTHFVGGQLDQRLYQRF